MPQYLSARALVRTEQSKPPVYCLRYNAVGTANLWFQEHFPCQHYRLNTCLTSVRRQLLWTMFWTMDIVLYSNFFSDVDNSRYLRKFTTNQVLLAELTCLQ